MRWKFASLVVLGLGAVGCGGGGPGSEAISQMDRASLGSEEQVRDFNQLNPILFYFMNHSLALGMDLPGTEGSVFEGDCPVVTRDGDEMRMVGGCTTEDGTRFEGELLFVTASSGLPHGKLTYKAFGVTQTEACGDGEVTLSTSYDGTMELSGDATASELRINVAMTGNELDEESCAAVPQTLGYDYEGTIDGPLPNLRDEESVLNLTPSTWNGKGRIGFSTHGFIDIELIDEVMDFQECSNGAQSGKAVYTGEKKVEFTFHGAEECGTSATWTLDGVDQGELEGVTCSALGGGTLSAFGLLALGGLLLRRRRSIS